jgi:acetyl esterase/lipase
VRDQRDVGERFNSAGWRTVAATYRNGPGGVEDVAAARDWIASRWGAGPDCVYGESSGGHWALTVAQQLDGDDDPPMTVAAAAPTDLAAWPAMVTDPPTRDYVQALVESVFGSDRRRLDAMSPARQSWDPTVGSRLLLVYAETDPVVPIAQGQLMADAAPEAELVALPAGDRPWIHGAGVEARVLDAVFEQILARLEERR